MTKGVLSSEAVSHTEKPLYGTGYTKYVLGVLVVVYVFNFVDLQILAILAPAIKNELGLSGTEIGALSGIALFAKYVCSVVVLSVSSQKI